MITSIGVNQQRLNVNANSGSERIVKEASMKSNRLSSDVRALETQSREVNYTKMELLRKVKTIAARKGSEGNEKPNKDIEKVLSKNKMMNEDIKGMDVDISL